MQHTIIKFAFNLPLLLKICGPFKQDLYTPSTYYTDLHLSFIIRYITVLSYTCQLMPFYPTHIYWYCSYMYISLAATTLQALLQTLPSIGFVYSSILCTDSHCCSLLRSKQAEAVLVCHTVLVISINNLSIMGKLAYILYLLRTTSLANCQKPPEL